MTEDLMEPTQNPYSSPGQVATAVQLPVNEGDGTGGVIPYKNPAALAAYYLGLFSLFPILGLLLAVPAFALGIMGLRARKRNPVIKGSVHAWIGVVMGGIFTVIWSLMIAGFIVAIFAR